MVAFPLRRTILFLSLAHAISGNVPNYRSRESISGEEMAHVRKKYPEVKGFDEDMLDDNENLPSRRFGYNDTQVLWPQGQVHYYMNPKHFTSAEEAMVAAAMCPISSRSCIRFIKMDKKPKVPTSYVEIVKTPNKCFSLTGKPIARSKIVLGEGCWNQSIIQHELFHTLGFIHEHARPDRDEYITLNLDNVSPDMLEAFKRGTAVHNTTFPSVSTFDFPYDIRSVMHYPAFIYSKQPGSKATIIPNDPNVRLAEVGAREGVGPTDLDYIKLWAMYKCPVNPKAANDAEGFRRETKTSCT